MAETMFAEIREEAGSDNTYRPMSGLAVAGLIGGLLSATALIGGVMWFVPGLAIVTSIAALRQVAGTARKGASLARAGLALAVMFLAAAISYGWWQDYVIRGQAQRVADMWVEALLSGNVRLAHQLSLGPVPNMRPPGVGQEPTKGPMKGAAMGPSRQSGGDRLEEIYSQNPALAQDLEAYGKHEVVAKVAEIGHVNQGTIASRQMTSQSTDPFQQIVGFRYELQYEENGHPETMSISLSVVRPLRHAPMVSGWQVNPLALGADEGPTEGQ
jgi:hypothetical protein